MNSLQVVYDLSMNPASYDFLPFLAVAEKHRHDQQLSCMDVHFMPDDNGTFYERYFPKDVSERMGMLWRVCVPACRLVKSVRDVHVYSKRQGVGGEKKYPETWAMSRPDTTHGQAYFRSAPRCFKSSEQARKWVGSKYHDYMTITLRECNYGEDRNSDRVEWWKVARFIVNTGASVVIVPDTYGNALKDFPNCIQAAWDIDIRLALYEGAILNMGVANGPMSLAVLSNSKFAMLDTAGSDINPDGNIVKGNIPASQLIPLIEPYLKAAA